jgi:predicted SAM-dependent methyltransferase
MSVRLKPLAAGIASFIPGMDKVVSKGTGGTDSARYCYSVWLRHLKMAAGHGLQNIPNTVAELGPGDSLGIGIAALLSGVQKYLAFDIVEHANISRNMKVFEELVELFRNRQDIPGKEEFPLVKPYMDSYEFPSGILPDNWLNQSLSEHRIETIRKSILDPTNECSLISYRAPWSDQGVVVRESVDMIYSQAVLEHIDDLQSTYESMYLWLKPEGFMSHQIDFKSHGTSTEWNGHWTYSEFVWKLIRGKRPYLLNRAPYSVHARLHEAEGFDIVFEKKVKSESNINRERLASQFKTLSDDDFTTSGAYILSIKR